LNDLSGNRRRFQTQALTDFLFYFRIEMSKSAHSPTNFSYRDSFPSTPQSDAIALHLVVPESERQSKRGGFGVDAVGTTDLRSMFELKGASLECLQKNINFL